MQQGLVGNVEEDDAPYGYVSRTSFYTHSVKWTSAKQPATCIGYRNRRGSRRPHAVYPTNETEKMVVREHKVRGSGYGASAYCKKKRLQCEACGNAAAKNPTREKREMKQAAEERQAKRRKVQESNDSDVICLKKLTVLKLKAVLQIKQSLHYGYQRCFD